MKSALLYCSPHGRTRKAVQHALQELELKPDVFDLAESQPREALLGYDLLVIFCPTYGDEELAPEMENYVVGLDLDLTGRHFILCELGNFYGYDDFSFGAMRILRARLGELGATEFCTPLSLDAMPKVNWGQLSRWVQFVNKNLRAAKA